MDLITAAIPLNSKRPFRLARNHRVGMIKMKKINRPWPKSNQNQHVKFHTIPPTHSQENVRKSQITESKCGGGVGGVGGWVRGGGGGGWAGGIITLTRCGLITTFSLKIILIQFLFKYLRDEWSNAITEGFAASLVQERLRWYKWGQGGNSCASW